MVSKSTKTIVYRKQWRELIPKNFKKKTKMKSQNEDVAKQLIHKYFLLALGLLWNGILGLFLAGVGMSLGGLRIAIVNLLVGLFTIVIYSIGIYWFRRKAIWLAIGTTIFINLTDILLNSGNLLENYLISIAISIDFLLLGESGLQVLKSTKNQSIYWKLTVLFIGSLIVGCILGILNFPS